MNIEEERKSFEGYVLSLSKYKKRSPKFIFDLDENGDYDNRDVYDLYHAWTASAQREGYKLVPMETLEECLSWATCASSESWSDEQRDEIDKHYKVIEKAMIGAAE